MGQCEEFLNAKIQLRIDYFNDNVMPFVEKTSVFLKEFEKFSKALAKAKKTGNYGPVSKVNLKKKDRDSLKENAGPNIDNTHISGSSLIGNPVKVKTEKLSVSRAVQRQNNPADPQENNHAVPQKNTQVMPAPSIIPPKRRVKQEKLSNILKVKTEVSDVPTRSTRSRAVERTSDLIIQNPVIPLVELSDSEEDKVPSARSTRTKTKKKDVAKRTSDSTERVKKNRVAQSAEESDDTVASVRSTRTKTRNQKKNENATVERTNDVENNGIQHKRVRSQSDTETANSTRKRSKSDPERCQAQNISGQTEYEDAMSDLPTNPANSTFVKKQDTMTNFMDTTIVVTKPKAPSQEVDDLLTDDESIEEPPKLSPQKAKARKNEVFSPYERSPVKKKVEAFEKFNTKDIPANSKANTSRILKEIEENKGNVREKANVFTPVTSKVRPNVGSTKSTSKISKYVSYKSNDSMSFRSPLTTSKSQYAPLKERDVKLQDRERELQKRAEERRKMQEEKLQKQQQKEEREKMKALEAQRLRDEKYKLMMKMKEEKQRLAREDNERKRLLVKKRAEEKKREEEKQRLAAEQERLKELKKNNTAENLHKRAVQNGATSVPVYFREPTPLLPCKDCYDSDEEEGNQKKTVPVWALREKTWSSLLVQDDLNYKLKNTLFCCQNHSVDLREIFEKIDPRKLKRTSSALWTRPPRFTMVPDIVARRL